MTNPNSRLLTLCLGASCLLSPMVADAQIESNWAQTNYFKASNPDSRDGFGAAVAISGTTIAISAPLEDSGAREIDGNQLDNSARDSGAVYIFVLVNGRWVQQAYIKASNADQDDRFGWSLALEGDLLVVGAPEEDGNARGINGIDSNNSSSNSGAVYLFERLNGRWQQKAYIKSSNSDPRDRFWNCRRHFQPGDRGGRA